MSHSAQRDVAITKFKYVQIINNHFTHQKLFIALLKHLRYLPKEICGFGFGIESATDGKSDASPLKPVCLNKLQQRIVKSMPC